MASLHELRELPLEGDFFLSFDDLLEVIRDASVKINSASRILIRIRNAPGIYAPTLPALGRISLFYMRGAGTLLYNV